MADVDPLGYERLRTLFLDNAKPDSTVLIDLEALGCSSLRTLEAATLLRLIAEGRTRSVTVRLAGLSDGARQAFAGLGPDVLDGPDDAEASLPLIEKVGAETLGIVDAARRVLGLIRDLLHYAFIAPLRGQGIKWDCTF